MSKKAKSSNRGRPKKPAGTHLSAKMLLYCHPDEKAAWEKLAEAAGLKLSAWVRAAANKEARKLLNRRG